MPRRTYNPRKGRVRRRGSGGQDFTWLLEDIERRRYPRNPNTYDHTTTNGDHS